MRRVQPRAAVRRDRHLSVSATQAASLSAATCSLRLFPLFPIPQVRLCGQLFSGAVHISVFHTSKLRLCPWPVVPRDRVPLSIYPHPSWVSVRGQLFPRTIYLSVLPPPPPQLRLCLQSTVPRHRAPLSIPPPIRGVSAANCSAGLGTSHYFFPDVSLSGDRDTSER